MPIDSCPRAPKMRDGTFTRHYRLWRQDLNDFKRRSGALQLVQHTFHLSLSMLIPRAAGRLNSPLQHDPGFIIAIGPGEGWK